jgi:DNA-binding NtrC family response regulator
MGIEEPEISDEAIEIMRTYHCPGNVRELENCLERALLVSQGTGIQKEHLSMRPPKKEIDYLSGTTSLRQGYREMIAATLDRCDGNVTKAVRELGIARSTFYRKKREFGI